MIIQLNAKNTPHLNASTLPMHVFASCSPPSSHICHPSPLFVFMDFFFFASFCHFLRPICESYHLELPCMSDLLLLTPPQQQSCSKRNAAKCGYASWDSDGNLVDTCLAFNTCMFVFCFVFLKEMCLNLYWWCCPAYKSDKLSLSGVWGRASVKQGASTKLHR